MTWFDYRLRRKHKDVLEGNEDDRFANANARGDKRTAIIDPARATPMIATPDGISWRKHVEREALTHAPKA